jgi:hypothetical protein
VLKLFCPFEDEFLAFLADQVRSANNRSQFIDKFLAADATLEFSAGV